MEISGTITKVLPIETGTSKAGNAFSRLTIVIQYDERYPKELALTFINKNADEYASKLAVGQQCKFFFDATSREYNGRYYTEAVAWKVEQASVAQPAPQPVAYAPAPAGYPQPAPAPQYPAPPAPAYPQQPAPNYAPQYGQYPQQGKVPF